MPNGTVKFFSAAKKFGFVSPDDGGKDVFIPIASVTAAGASALVAGQRIAFETAPDSRGPKAVDLKLLESPKPVPAPAREKTPPPARAAVPRQLLTFYYDPADEEAVETLVALRESGFDPRVVDYMATTPSANELQRLSMNLPAGSLVRRYDPLFRDLRLDDRFISQGDFWTGIFEHPTLIDGPILATANRACICRSDSVVADFLESVFPGRPRVALESKPLPERTVTPAPEITPVETPAAVAETAAPEAETVEPADSVAPAKTRKTAKDPQEKKKAASTKTAATSTAAAPARKTAKTSEKKDAGVKTAAAKAAKTAAPKPASKQPSTKAKKPAAR